MTVYKKEINRFVEEKARKHRCFSQEEKPAHVRRTELARVCFDAIELPIAERDKRRGVTGPVIGGIDARHSSHVRSEMSVLFDYEHVWEVSIFFRIIDSIAHDKAIFNSKTHIVTRNIDFSSCLLVHEADYL